MKSIINVKIYAILILGVFLISSCTATKRRYNKGWHIESFFGNNKKPNEVKSSSVKHNSSQSESRVFDNSEQLEDNHDLSFSEPKIPLKEALNTQQLSTLSEKSEKKMVEFKIKKEKTPKHGIVKKAIVKNALHKIKKFENKNTQPSNEGSSGKGIGVVLLIVGLLILLFVSILLGAILMLLGIILMASSNKNPTPTEKSDAMIDVVYLKNGGQVRGTIVEQVPGISLKIQTKDGSIFVYKMEEIEKMTKEKAL